MFTWVINQAMEAYVTTKKTYGLLIERKNNYGTEYVIARVVCREPGHDYPRGCSSDGEQSWDDSVPKFAHGQQLDGLSMHGFVSDFNDCDYIGYEAEYRDVYAVELPKAHRMFKTLRKVTKARQKDKAYDPSDTFVSLAKCLHLTFACWRVGDARADFRDGQYVWADIAEGRNHFRRLIEQAKDEMRVRLGKKVAA